MRRRGLSSSPLRVGVVLVAIVTGADPSAAELTPREERLAAAIEIRRPEAISLLRSLVDVNSGTQNFDGVREVGRMVDAELVDLGFETTWVEGEAFDRAGHLVGHRPGGPTHVLLIGHLDTVFEPDSPFQTYKEIDEHHAAGPGTTDMKGGLVVMLEVLRGLSSIDRLDALTFTAVITGDEESSGDPLDLARRHLIEAGREADLALGFEDGDGRFATAVIARRGSTDWTLEVTGTPYHSSQVFTEAIGYGAIYEASRILHGFRAALEHEENLTFNPGLIAGGTDVELDPDGTRARVFGKDNIVAEHAVVSGDLRAMSPAQLEYAKRVMHEVVADSLPGTSANLVIDDGYPPMAPTDGNRRLLGLIDSASRDLGLGAVDPVDPRNAGAADISFVAGDVEMAVDGLGLMGTGGHTVEEVADLRTLVSQAQRVAVTLDRLAD